MIINFNDKGTFQKRFSGFCPLRGYPHPPTPLTENHFAKKPLAKNRQKKSKKMGQKGLKLAFLGQK